MNSHESYSLEDLTEPQREALLACPVAAGSYTCPPLGTMRALERRGLVYFARGVSSRGGGPNSWVLTDMGARVLREAAK